MLPWLRDNSVPVATPIPQLCTRQLGTCIRAPSLTTAGAALSRRSSQAHRTVVVRGQRPEDVGTGHNAHALAGVVHNGHAVELVLRQGSGRRDVAIEVLEKGLQASAGSMQVEGAGLHTNSGPARASWHSCSPYHPAARLACTPHRTALRCAAQHSTAQHSMLPSAAHR